MKHSTLSQQFLAASALAVLAASIGAAQQVSDHPLVPRFVGSTIYAADSSIIDFEEFPLVTGPFKEGKFSQVQKLEGKITHLHYINPPNRSTFEVFKVYQNSLKQNGFQVLFACSDTECGEPTNNDLMGRWVGRWCEGISIQCPEPMRYLAAKLTRPGGDVYVALRVRTNAGGQFVGTSDGSYLNVIEIKEMDGHLVSASAGNPPTADTAAAPPPVRRTVMVGTRIAPAPSQMVPSGSEITIRMIDSVDSQHDQLGQTFRASLDTPVNDAQGNVLAPRGANVIVKLVNEQQSGKLTGRAVLTLGLVSMNVNGHDVDLDSSDAVVQSGSRGKRSIGLIGGGASAGAIIGALAGGKRAAAIGAASGAGAGAAVEVLTKGQRVRIPPETRLIFKLKQAARL